MKKEELSESIREGLNKSREDFWKEILKAEIIIIIILVIGFFALIKYDSYQMDKYNKCIEEGLCVQPTLAVEPNCNKPFVHCFVIDKDIENKMIQESNGGGIRPIIQEKSFCGYTEANEWFKQYQEKVGGNLYIDCS